MRLQSSGIFLNIDHFRSAVPFIPRTPSQNGRIPQESQRARGFGEEFNKKAKEQKDLGKKIQALLINARKDSAKRKTQNWQSKSTEQLQ